MQIHEVSASADMTIPAERVWAVAERVFPGQGWEQMTGPVRSIRFNMPMGDSLAPWQTTMAVETIPGGSRLTVTQRVDLAAVSEDTAARLLTMVTQADEAEQVVETARFLEEAFSKEGPELG